MICSSVNLDFFMPDLPSEIGLYSPRRGTENWKQVKGKVTRREKFLSEMDAVIPWKPILALIEPHYPKAGNGTQPMPMERMLRTYFMQQWFNLSDPGMEDALYDSEAMRRFAGAELIDDAIPDKTTIRGFLPWCEACSSRSGCC